MASTPRLGLYKPVGTDLINPMTAISNQMGFIDNKLLAVICTSTTRPTTPFTGQEIYETDTNKFRFWTGSAWQDISDGSLVPIGGGGSNVKGRQGFFIGNWATNFDIQVNEEEGPAMTAQLNLQKGRRYRFHVGWNVVRSDESSDGMPAVLRLRGGEGATVTTSSPLLYSGMSDYLDNFTDFSVAHHLVAHVDLPGSGTTQHTFGTFIFRQDSFTIPGGLNWSLGTTTYQYIAIEDVGAI